MRQIPFNKPTIIGNELKYIQDAVLSGKISGNGNYTKMCQAFFRDRFRMEQTLLTTSCTDALEMAAILIDVKPGDEIIMPSYTFVSTANAFVLRGANIIFADSYDWHPNLDADQIESLVTDKTKAIVPVHYGGMACDMDKIMTLAAKHNLYVIEDAAQAIDATYKNDYLGSIGDLATFSFHETKNIISGEGGLLAINNKNFADRAEIIWEKGTNRAAFFRGEVNKYGWVDVGSSFLPTELVAAFLYAQLEQLRKIQDRRIDIWDRYNEGLQDLEASAKLLRPVLPPHASKNGHLFYIVLENLETRTALIEHLKRSGIYAVFHYLSLHKSPFYEHRHDGRALVNSDKFSDSLLRLPFFYELSDENIDSIITEIHTFFTK
jgi:dTDP-4-amino-4,6-dideoxygalactose transaminase